MRSETEKLTEIASARATAFHRDEHQLAVNAVVGGYAQRWEP